MCGSGWHGHRIGDRRERRHRLPALRMAQGVDQRAMAAHRMAEQASAVTARRKLRFDQRRQFDVDVLAHPVVRRPGRLRGVEIEAGADAEIPGFRIAGQSQSARAGVAGHQHQAQFGCTALRTGLDDEVFLGAGQPGEIVQRRHLAARGLRRHEYGEAHRAGVGRALMRVEALHAAEAGVQGAGDETHARGVGEGLQNGARILSAGPHRGLRVWSRRPAAFRTAARAPPRAGRAGADRAGRPPPVVARRGCCR